MQISLAMLPAGLFQSSYSGNTSGGNALFGWIGGLTMSSSTFTLAANTLYKIPVFFPRATVIKQASIYVTASVGSGTVRLGLRNALLSGATVTPTTLVADWGTVADTGTGHKIISSLSTPVNPGLYFAELVSDGIPGLQGGGFAFPTLGAQMNGATGAVLTRAFTAGALPADETSQNLTFAVNNTPWLGVKDY
jgi:hypothetical protein